MEILHDVQLQKFYCVVDGLEAHLNYRYDGERTLNYYHTYVPPTLRNQGIAQAIVAEAARYALKHNLTVIPSCSYVTAFFRRYAEYAEIVRYK